MQRRAFLKASLLSMSTSSVLHAGWRLAKPLPSAKQEIYPTIHNNQIVVAGGLYVDEQGKLGVSNTVEAYDISSQQWLKLPNLPEPRHHPMLCSVDNKLYAISGFVASDQGIWTASTEVLLLDEQANQWTKLEAARMPFPMCETVSMVHDSEIHLVTGRRPSSSKNGNWRDHGDINHHLIFNTQSKSWREGPPAPNARNSAAAAVIDGKWYVVGGRTVADGNTATLEVYDPKMQQWHSRPSMPQAQGGLAAAALDKTLYVFGGEYFDQGGGVYPEVWSYQTDKALWQQASFMPVPRHGLGALTVNNEIYVIAGAAKAGGNETTKRLSIFKP